MRGRRRLSAAVVAVTAGGLLVGPAHAAAPSARASVTALKAISPTAGPARGGNQLTISGTGLSGVTAVHFGSAVSKRITHLSATLLSVRVPKHVAGAVDVRLVSGPATSVRTGRGRYSFTAGAGDLRWGRTRTIDPTRGALIQVSCGTPAFCVAIDSRFRGRNRLIRFGVAGRGISTVAPARGIDPVACASATYCIAGSAAAATEWNGHSWSAVHRLARWPYTEALTCAPESTLCVLATADYWSAKWTPSSHALRRVPARPAQAMETSSSCLPGTGCVFVDDAGHEYQWTAAHSWTSVRNVVPAQGAMSDVSCASTTWCVAVDGDGNGNELSWNGRGWARPRRIDRLGPLAAVSCVSRAFCVAVGSAVVMRTNGRWACAAIGRPPWFRGCVLRECPLLCRGRHGWPRSALDGHQWSAPAVAGGGGLLAVSCASSSSCLAVGKGSARWDGHSWHQVANPPPAWNLTDVDCVSPRYCASGGIGGFYIRHDGLWSAAISPSIAIDEVWLSCATARLCIGEADIAEGTDVEDYAFDGASVRRHARYSVGGTPDCVAHLCASVDYETATIGRR